MRDMLAHSKMTHQALLLNGIASPFPVSVLDSKKDTLTGVKYIHEDPEFSRDSTIFSCPIKQSIGTFLVFIIIDNAVLCRWMTAAFQQATTPGQTEGPYPSSYLEGTPFPAVTSTAGK